MPAGKAVSCALLYTRMRHAYLLPVAVLLSAASCQTWKAAPRKPDARVCGDTSASVPHLTWTPATDMPKMKEPLPSVYRVYVVPYDEANTFFTAVGKQTALEVRVPLAGACAVFQVTGSGPTSETAKEKNPDRITARGTAPGGDLRLDWDGKVFSGQATSGGATFLIRPRTAGDKTWYLIYEARPDAQTPPPMDRQKLTPRYDR